MSSYVPPIEVVSPKRHWTLVSVLDDQGDDNAALALGRWDGDPVLALRWNGNKESPLGNPQSRGLPTWFVVPRDFHNLILTKLGEREPQKEARAREFFVEFTIRTNTIAMPDCRRAIQKAVVEGFGEHLYNEPWCVRIFEPQSGPEYIIQMKGPQNFIWERTFFGPHEQTPEFIREEIRGVVSGRTIMPR